jgi:hypothetical protein
MFGDDGLVADPYYEEKWRKAFSPLGFDSLVFGDIGEGACTRCGEQAEVRAVANVGALREEELGSICEKCFIVMLNGIVEEKSPEAFYPEEAKNVRIRKYNERTMKVYVAKGNLLCVRCRGTIKKGHLLVWIRDGGTFHINNPCGNGE